MIRIILTSILLLSPLMAQSGDLVLGDLRARNATQLSKDELTELMPNAKVFSDSRGRTRRWKNEAGGKFVANSDGRRHTGALGKQNTGHGTWHVGDNGTYCVTIEWPKRTENWCKYIFKADDRYYGVKSLTDGGAEANEFGFKH